MKNWSKLSGFFYENKGKLIKLSTVIEELKCDSFSTSSILSYISILYHTGYIRILKSEETTKIGILDKKIPGYNEVYSQDRLKNSGRITFKINGKYVKK